MVASFRDRYGPWALVAGAAAGLGAQWARQVAGRGLDLVLIDRDGPRLETTAAEIEAGHGVSVRPVTLDLARDDLLVALGPEVADREIGLVVYNAAIGSVAPFLELDAGQLQAIIDVNCRAPMLLVATYAPDWATTSAICGSPRRAVTSFTSSAPSSSARRATSALAVSI